MINIAIVEDEKLYVSQLKEYISRYEKEITSENNATDNNPKASEH